MALRNACAARLPQAVRACLCVCDRGLKGRLLPPASPAGRPVDCGDSHGKEVPGLLLASPV